MDLNSLFDESVFNKNRNIAETYEKILQRIYKRIKVVNRTKKLGMAYKIPPVMLTEAGYKLKECVVYVMTKLRKQNFVVQYRNPNILVVSWEKVMRNMMDKKNNKKPSHVTNTRGFSQKKINTHEDIRQKSEKKIASHFGKMNNDIIRQFEESGDNFNEMDELERLKMLL